MQFLDDIFGNLGDWFSGLANWLQIVVTILIVGLVIGVFVYLAVAKSRRNGQFSSNHKMAIIGIMASVAFIMTRFKIPYGPTGFLSIELSFLVFYLVAKVVDIRTAVATIFVTSTIHYLITGSAVGIPLDQSMFFLSSLLYLLAIVYVENRVTIVNEKYRFIGGIFIATLFVTIVMTVMNFFITAPIYYELFGAWPYEQGTWPGVFEQKTFLEHVIIVYGSFNVVKWSVVGVATFAAQPALERIEKALKRTSIEY